jgi:hypothetical protein
MLDGHAVPSQKNGVKYDYCPRREALHFRAQPLDTAQLAHLTGLYSG